MYYPKHSQRAISSLDVTNDDDYQYSPLACVGACSCDKLEGELLGFPRNKSVLLLGVSRHFTRSKS